MKFDTTEIKTKLKEVEELCKKNSVPFFAAIAVSNDDEKTEYENYLVSPRYLTCPLTNDYITPMLLVTNGFKVMKYDKEDKTFEFLSRGETDGKKGRIDKTIS